MIHKTKEIKLESILIADDDIGFCTVLSEELREVGYNVDLVHNGQEAIEYLAENKVDILLLDLIIPVRNGFEVLMELNQNNTKAIVLTACADVKNAIDAVRLGARHIIRKPYDFDEVLIAIREVLVRER